MKILLTLISIFLMCSNVSANVQSIEPPPGEPGAPRQTSSGAPYP